MALNQRILWFATEAQYNSYVTANNLKSDQRQIIFINDSAKMIIKGTTYTGNSLPTTGGTMTGDITFRDDGEGIIFYNGNGGKVYKRVGGGLTLRMDNANADPVVETFDGNTRYTILHQNNFNSWAAKKAGDTGQDFSARNLYVDGIVLKTNIVAKNSDNTNNYFLGAEANGLGNGGRGTLLYSYTGDIVLWANADAAARINKTTAAFVGNLTANGGYQVWDASNDALLLKRISQSIDLAAANMNLGMKAVNGFHTNAPGGSSWGTLVHLGTGGVTDTYQLFIDSTANMFIQFWNNGTSRSGWKKVWTDANSNLSTVPWTCSNLTAAGTLSVTGATTLNSTLSVDGNISLTSYSSWLNLYQTKGGKYISLSYNSGNDWLDIYNRSLGAWAAIRVADINSSGTLSVSGISTFTNKSFFNYGNNGQGTYSWVDAALTTNSIEIVNSSSTSTTLAPTLAFHRYGSGGPQFRLDATGTNILWLESAAANSARSNTANGTTYFDSLRLTSSNVNGIYINGNNVWHAGNFTPSNYITNLTGTAAVAGHFSTTGSTSGILVKIPYQWSSGSSWMISFTLRIYQSYKFHDILFSGYNYQSSKWYSPKARLLAGSDDIIVKMGWDTDGYLYVWAQGGSYTGATVFNVNNGYRQYDWTTSWQITDASDCPNAQYTETLKPPVLVGDTVNYANSAGYISTVGNQTAISGTSRHPTGLRLAGIYANGYPFSYGNTIQIQGGLFGSELAFNCLGGGGATGTGSMIFRTQSDWGNSEWGAWKTIIDSTNISYQTVASAGNSTTTSQRTFGNVRTDGINRGSYGTVSITGTNNGYAGIDFTDVNATFMIRTDGFNGVYKNNNTWSWYFDGNGNLVVGTVPWGNISNKPSSLSTGSSGALRISTGTGYADLGSQNAGFFHLQTDRPTFYMNKSLNVDGEIRVYNSNTYLNSGSGYIAGNTIVHSGNVASYTNKWYDGWVNVPGYDANTIGASKSGFSYSNNCPNTGCLVHFDAGGYGLQLSSLYHSGGGSIGFRTRNGDNNTWNSWYNIIHSGNIGSQSVNYASSAGNANTLNNKSLTQIQQDDCLINYILINSSNRYKMYAEYKEFNRYLFYSTSSYTAELPDSIFPGSFASTVGTTLVIKLSPTSGGSVTFYPPPGYALYDSNGDDYGSIKLNKGDTVEILMYRFNMNAVVYQTLTKWT